MAFGQSANRPIGGRRADGPPGIDVGHHVGAEGLGDADELAGWPLDVSIQRLRMLPLRLQVRSGGNAAMTSSSSSIATTGSGDYST
jgi:hypothetical protein